MGYLDYMKQKKDPFSYDESEASKSENPNLAGAFQQGSSSKNTTDAINSGGGDQKKGIDYGQTAGAAGAGASVGGPWGAAIAAAGSLASQYLAQSAADERAKRERQQQIIKGHSDDEQQIINSIMQNNARALS